MHRWLLLALAGCSPSLAEQPLPLGVEDVVVGLGGSATAPPTCAIQVQGTLEAANYRGQPSSPSLEDTRAAWTAEEQGFAMAEDHGSTFLRCRYKVQVEGFSWRYDLTKDTTFEDVDPAWCETQAAHAEAVDQIVSSTRGCRDLHHGAYWGFDLVPLERFRVAVTLDDIPWNAGPPAEGAAKATDRLLAAMTERRVPATGFVNCGRGEEAIWQQWRAAGFELGNHQADHDNLNKTPQERWLAGVQSCNEALAKGAPVRFFRYPYLRNGDSEALRDTTRAALLGMGLTIARVSVDNHEWKLADLYAKALAAGDADRAEDIARAYALHVLDATRHFRRLGRAQEGREIDHVLLLHANTLAADHLGWLLDALRADGADFIPLEQALKDPIYAKPDRFVGTGGVSWLYHTDPSGFHADNWDDAAWARLAARFGG
ncbi:MAG: polysaccharide deacetylase family protein [Alphaproteobacteria bacterium]|nr:polysaccharide deacetylase family protein [Alphaproteobacteria bacterium]